MRNTIKAGLAAVAALALVALGAPLAASAHTPNASLNCETATVNLTAYDQAATATVVLDGVTLRSGTFGGHLVTSYPTGGGNTEHHLVVQVKSFDQLNEQGVSPYDYAFDQTTSGCYTAPPKAEVTGSVSFADGSCIDGVRIGNSAEVAVVDGVRYSYTLDGGAVNPLPSQGYDESSIVPGTYVVTAEANDPAHFVYVGTASWSHTFAAIPLECAPPVVVVPPAAANPDASIAASCGTATVTVRNDLGDAAERLTASFVVYVDGVFHEALVATGGAVVTGSPITFAEDSGTHTVTVRTGPAFGDELLASATVSSDCEPAVVVPPTEEPPVVEPPVVVPPVVDEPVVPAASVDRLAYTGTDSGTLAAAVVAGVLALLLGAGAIVASRTRTPRYRRTPSE